MTDFDGTELIEKLTRTLVILKESDLLDSEIEDNIKKKIKKISEHILR